MSEEIKEEMTMADFEDQLDKDTFENPKWANFAKQMEDKTNIEASIDGVVKGGFVVKIDEVRAFLPISHASLKRIEKPESMLGKDITVRIIEVERDSRRLVVSARDILREERQKERDAKIASIKVGEIFDGKVDSIQDFGAFVKLENGISGLVHISQIAIEKIKHPKDRLKVGDEVKIKVIKNQDGKLSFSMKALIEDAQKAEAEKEEKIVIPEAEIIGTNIGDLLKGIELPD